MTGIIISLAYAGGHRVITGEDMVSVKVLISEPWAGAGVAPTLGRLVWPGHLVPQGGSGVITVQIIVMYQLQIVGVGGPYSGWTCQDGSPWYLWEGHSGCWMIMTTLWAVYTARSWMCCGVIEVVAAVANIPARYLTHCLLAIKQRLYFLNTHLECWSVVRVLAPAGGHDHM